MDIESLTVESEFELLLKRLVDFSLVPEGQLKFMYVDGNASSYERLILNSTLTKPTLSEFETELENYKEELRIAKAAAEAQAAIDLAEYTRVMEWEARLDSIPNLREVLVSINKNEPNLKMFVKKFISNRTVEELELLEAKSAQLLVISNKKEAVELKAKRGKDVRRFCSYLLDVVAGNNIDEALTDAELDVMEADLGAIQLALSRNRPMKAKVLIEGITDPKYAALKTLALAIYAEAGI